MTNPSVDTGTTMRRSLDSFFTNSARLRPEYPALFVQGRYWTYRQLDAECKAIEHTLDAAGLAGTGGNVGLLYAGAMFSYAAAVAIMRSNCVYVPLNPKMPAARLLRIIEDAGIEAIIVDAGEALLDGPKNALSECRSRPLQLILQPGSTPDLESTTPQHRVWRIGAASPSLKSDGTPPTPTTLAYIIYTSGSTGIPKGVAITHESACRCMEKLQQLFPTSETDRFTQFSALSFDVSIADLFWCWQVGATLYVPAPSETLVPLQFAATHQLTVWSSVPSLASFLFKLKLCKPNSLPHIRLTLFAGEALPTELAQAWSTAAPNSRIFNVYGPTECTIYSSFYEHDPHSSPQQGIVPIGHPLPGLQSMIVDDGRPITQDNVPGELWLSGDQLAVGYWNNPAGTSASFVRFPPDAPAPQRWYRTGDLVSRHTGLGLSYRGRLDRQVKLRGYRIELQEVESALREIIGCALAAVVPLHNASGLCQEIVAYCDKLGGDEATIKARCLTRLPRYMIPDRIFELDPLPLSDHGKIDYRALAARAAGLSTNSSALERTNLMN